jgi:hypothetical protein
MYKFSTFQIWGKSSLNLSATSTQNFFVGAHFGHVDDALPLDNTVMALRKNPDLMYFKSSSGISLVNC